MLIRFKVANFLSFKEETEFSMVAGRERLHPNHVVKGEKNQPNLLRAALLYGANAAGKSNFVKAIDYAIKRITGRNSDVANDNFTINTFRFQEKYKKTSRKFMFEFISNNKIFNYSFEEVLDTVISEKLIDLTDGKEKILFDRKTLINGQVEFQDTNYPRKKVDQHFLKFVQRSTNPNKFFLLHCIENNVPWFLDAFVWFITSINIIFPDTFDLEIEKRLIEDTKFKDFFTNVMKSIGTGITAVEVEAIAKDFSKKDIKSLFLNLLQRDFQMNLVHENNIKFDRSEESDGTRRLFDLAFPFYDLAASETPKIYIIDELERNLHTNLSYMLLKSYLEQEGKGQLIATTHDTHLLDLELLRKDEIWFAEKDEHGATQLYSLYEFNPRYDKKIEKEYLTGRFGAIPFLGNFEFKKKLAKNGKSKK